MMKKLIKSSRVNKKLVADLDYDVLEYALSTFIKNGCIEMDNIYTCLKEENFTQLKSIAHKLVGSAIVVGLEDFSKRSQEIELAENDKISLKSIKSLHKEFLLIEELAK